MDGSEGGRQMKDQEDYKLMGVLCYFSCCLFIFICFCLLYCYVYFIEFVD